jgi:hypothetical protein
MRKTEEYHGTQYTILHIQKVFKIILVGIATGCTAGRLFPA